MFNAKIKCESVNRFVVSYLLHHPKTTVLVLLNTHTHTTMLQHHLSLSLFVFLLYQIVWLNQCFPPQRLCEKLWLPSVNLPQHGNHE